MVGLAAAATTLATSALDSLLDGGRVSWQGVPGMVLTSALYAVVLAPIVVLSVSWLVRRITPDILVG
jgi:hypothetical protein